MAQQSGYGAGSPPVDDLTAGVTGGTPTGGAGIGGSTSTTGTTGASTGGSGTTDQAKEKASQAAGQAQQVAGQAKEQAAQQAQQVKGKASGAVRTQIDQRSTQAGEQVKTQASDIRTVGQQLREQGKEGPAKVADQAADRIERVGDYLHRADSDTILSDVEQFGRSNPWAVIAGGITAGFLAARALKASSSTRYQSSSRQIPAAGRTTTGNGLGTTSGYTTGGSYGGATTGTTGGATVGGGVTGTGAATGSPTAFDSPTNRPAQPATEGTANEPGTGARPPAGGF